VPLTATVSRALEKTLGLELRDMFIRRFDEKIVFGFNYACFPGSRNFLCIKSFES